MEQEEAPRSRESGSRGMGEKGLIEIEEDKKGYVERYNENVRTKRHLAAVSNNVSTSDYAECHIVLQLHSPLHHRLTSPSPLLSFSPLALAVFISNPRICE